LIQSSIHRLLIPNWFITTDNIVFAFFAKKLSGNDSISSFCKKCRQSHLNAFTPGTDSFPDGSLKALNVV
jgi:hypothetical protein